MAVSSPGRRSFQFSLLFGPLLLSRYAVVELEGYAHDEEGGEQQVGVAPESPSATAPEGESPGRKGVVVKKESSSSSSASSPHVTVKREKRKSVSEKSTTVETSSVKTEELGEEDDVKTGKSTEKKTKKIKTTINTSTASV